MRALEGQPTIDPRTVGGGNDNLWGGYSRRKHQTTTCQNLWRAWRSGPRFDTTARSTTRGRLTIQAIATSSPPELTLS